MNTLNFNPFPILKTERLTLRRLANSDAQKIFSLRSNDVVNKFIGRDKPNSIIEVEEFIQKINDGIDQNKSIYWVVCLNENKDLVGTICLWNFSDDNLSAELGYELLPEYFGKGIMNDTVKSIIDFCKTVLKLKAIEAYTHKDNVASINLLKRNNFIQNQNKKDNENPNNLIYSLKF